eukprot:scaffold7340_cov266-Pinguiococcus_pyrenoidosus.AAC.33
MKKAASAENAAASEERNAGTSSRQRRGLRIEASSKSGAPVEEDDNRPRTLASFLSSLSGLGLGIAVARLAHSVPACAEAGA